MNYPYAKINRLKLIEILQKSSKEDVTLCFGKAVTTIWMPNDVSKNLYKFCRDGKEEQ